MTRLNWLEKLFFTTLTAVSLVMGAVNTTQAATIVNTTSSENEFEHLSDFSEPSPATDQPTVTAKPISKNKSSDLKRSTAETWGVRNSEAAFTATIASDNPVQFPFEPASLFGFLAVSVWIANEVGKIGKKQE